MENEKHCEKCAKYATSILLPKLYLCCKSIDCECHALKNKPQEQNWEKEFDLSFDYLWQHTDEQQTTQHEAVKSFIRSLLQTQKAEIMKKNCEYPELAKAEAMAEFEKELTVHKAVIGANYDQKLVVELAELKEKIIKELGGMKKDGWNNFGKKDLTEKEESFNQAISDAIEIIKKI